MKMHKQNNIETYRITSKHIETYRNVINKKRNINRKRNENKRERERENLFPWFKIIDND